MASPNFWSMGGAAALTAHSWIRHCSGYIRLLQRYVDMVARRQRLLLAGSMASLCGKNESARKTILRLFFSPRCENGENIPWWKKLFVRFSWFLGKKLLE